MKPPPIVVELQDCAPLEWLGAAFQASAGRLAKAGIPVSAAGIVFAAIEDAIRTLRVLPNEEDGWSHFMLLRGDPEGRADYMRMLAQAMRGGAVDDRGRPFPSPQRVRHMVGVRAHAPVGMDQPGRQGFAVEWELLCRLARGKSSRALAAYYGSTLKLGKSSIDAKRSKHLAAIAGTYGFLIPSGAALS